MFVDDSTTACLRDATACAVEGSERARQREIAAYLSAASFPPDLPSGPLPDPLLNADPTLNALVQLGAHRLGCDRAFLSFIDRQYQFVVAEITRSHSLVDKRSAPNEHIFLGVTKLDACWGVCPTTMKAFMDEAGEWVRTGPNVIANRTRYIINDFTTEPGYTERPYVLNYPYFRSYLEVPLVSPLGYLLGSYCVVHNDLKEYDDDATVEIMNEIAAAIMAHLELRRVQQSRDRSEQLIQGLSGFINYDSPITQPDVMSRSTEALAAAGPAVGEITAGGHRKSTSAGEASWNWNESSADNDSSGNPRPPINHASSSLEYSDTLSIPAGNDSSETPPTTPRDEVQEDPFARLCSQADPAASAGFADDTAASTSDATEVYGNGFISSANIKSTLYRAAATIRRSMNMDGFMFLDAIPSSFSDRSDQLPDDDQRDLSREEVVGPFCAAIVQSTATQTPDRLPNPSPTRLPEAALQRFIRRYPHGHIFSADEFGPIDEIYAPGKPFPAIRTTDDGNQVLRNDVATLFRVIPDAKYIIFRPLWHFQQECWYAVALGWVADPTRAIDPVDISLVAAFGNSVMAEVSRMEALATSRAKSDFVSSISHELRSPLHGIMAGSELLREEISHNPLLVSTLDILDSCGTTLLDVFNNLLEHAIVTSSGGRYRTTVSDVKYADLGGLVEDVLDVVHTSHLSENAFQSSDHRKGSFAVGPSSPGKAQAHRPLLITLDIGKRAGWKVPVNTGAWKRIVMNVFGNALKYTNSGRIQVTLKEVQRPDRSGNPCDYVAFSVEDTGRGMSSDYLKYKLFMPFSQENTHSPGMGLGLSIVQQLARGLGGSVDVKSSVGVGTLVEVLVPVNQNPVETASISTLVEHDRPSYEAQKRVLVGKTACLITPEAYRAMGNSDLQLSPRVLERSTAVEHALKTNAGKTLEMKIVLATAEWPNPPADVYVLDDNLINTSVTDGAEGFVPALFAELSPLVLLCAGAGPPSCLKQEALKKHMFHLHHPLGPRKLASVLCAAIEDGPRPVLQAQLAVRPTPVAGSLQAPIIPTDAKDIGAGVEALRSTLPTHETITSSEKSTEASSRLPSGSYHLLLVDDNPINVKLLTMVMRKLKHTFATACNGAEAVDLYKESLKTSRQFDMIFMDLSMPVMDGFEATREIRQLETQANAKRCKVVALTGLSSEESRDEALASGCDVFLTKPAKLNVVRRLMDELGERR